MHISEIDTPALVVDLDIFERNLARVADYAREHSLRLRPHTKTHKSVRLAKRQIASGASGLTVAKVSEAEVMASAEPADLLVAYPIIGQTKLARLTQVARNTPVTVALDSTFAARQLSDERAQASNRNASACNCSVGTASNTRPSCLARSALAGSPEQIISAASDGPIKRGKRWVPPQPGNRPIFTSGSPSSVFGCVPARR